MEKSIKPWQIYLWETGDIVWGVAPIVTIDGLKELYRENCQFQKDQVKSKWKAENQIKKQLSNTMNAINWYGKKILDKNGNVDPKKFEEAEIKAAVTSSGIQVDIATVKPIKKFKTIKITEREAVDYNFY